MTTDEMLEKVCDWEGLAMMYLKDSGLKGRDFVMAAGVMAMACRISFREGYRTAIFAASRVVENHGNYLNTKSLEDGVTEDEAEFCTGMAGLIANICNAVSALGPSIPEREAE